MSIRSGLALSLAVSCLVGHSYARPGPQDARPAERELRAARSPFPREAVPAFTFELVVGEQSHDVRLEAHSMRSRSAARTGAGARTPDRGEPAWQGVPVRTYRGTVAAWPGSIVAASLLPDGLRATVVGAPDGRVWFVDDAGPGGALRVQRDDDARADGPVCEVFPARDGSAPQRRSTSPSPGSTHASTTTLLAELAYDADHPFYVLNGSSVPSSVAVIEGVMNSVSAIYEYYTGLQITLVDGFVRTSEAEDPYTGFGPGCAWMLGAFESHWLCAYTTPTCSGFEQSVTRDIAHLFTGVQPSGANGCAYQYSACQYQNHYALSSFAGPGYGAREIALVAHELGHTLGACHCDQGGCSQQDLAGCVMWSGGNYVSFGPATLDRFELTFPGFACLTTPGGQASPAPVLQTIRAEVEALSGDMPPVQGEWVTITGLDLETAVFVEESTGNVLDLRDFTVTASGDIEYRAEVAQALGSVSVTVVGAGGTSNSIDYEYVECSEAKLAFPYDPASTPLGNMTWKYCGPLGLEARLLFSRSGATTSVNGHTILSSPTVLKTETLGDPGVGSHTLVIAQSACGESFHMQVALYSGSVLVDTSVILHHTVNDVPCF